AGVADEANQGVGAGQVGHQSEARLAHGELHVVGDDAQVTGEGELEAGADGVALHGGDGHQVAAPPPGERLLVLGDDRVERGLVAACHVDERRFALDALGREHLPVEPRGEGLALAPQHHDPDGARQQPARLGQRAPQGGAHGAALCAVGQRHRGDRVVHGEPYAVLVEYRAEVLGGRSHGAPPMGAVVSRAVRRDGSRTAARLSDCTVTTRPVSRPTGWPPSVLWGAGGQAEEAFLPRVAPPRPRSVTPDSLSMRCTKPYERPVSSANARMLAPASYFFFRSAASLSRAAPVTRLPFFRVSATRASSWEVRSGLLMITPTGP